MTAPLINFANIPGNQISGLSDDLLNFASSESADRMVIELSKDFVDCIDNICPIIPTLSDEQLETLRLLESEAIPDGTNEQTKRHVSMFRNFLKEKKLCENFENVPDVILCDYLRYFYSQLKTKESTYYAPASLICIRASLHRHLTSVHIDRNVNILNGDNFRRANACLKAMIGHYLKSGQQRGKTYEPITESDMTKLGEYFDRSSHLVLQDEVLFNLIFYFGLRGRENLRALKKDTFEVEVDSDGKEYVSLKSTMMSKNVKASLSQKEFKDIKNTRMYSSDDENRCPVLAFKKYLSMLPAETMDNTLFPKPIKSGFASQAVIGKDTLGNLIRGTRIIVFV